MISYVSQLLEERLRDRHPELEAAVLSSFAGHEDGLVAGKIVDKDFVVRELVSRGIVIEAVGNDNNFLILDPRGNASLAGLRIRCFATDGIIYIGRNCLAQGLIRMHAPCATAIVLGDNLQPAFFQMTLWSKGNMVFIGARTTSNGTQLVAMGEEASIVIGEDCMFSTGVWVKTSDMHCIVDLKTNRMINKMGNAGDIVIGKHAWIGQDVLVALGVEIGEGAIIGAKSFVNKSVTKFSLNVGIPARELRTGVTWLRSHALVPAEYDAVRRDLGI
jgi:carbonic anhydrase/acetyltransferase-like protein (isoleucine patch superfamily)